MIDESYPNDSATSEGAEMETRADIFAERAALKRSNRKFVFAVFAVTVVSALILYPTVGRAAGLALAQFLQ